MSNQRPTAITLLAMGVMSFLFGCSKPSASQHAKQVFSELSQEDGTRLERQRRVVAAVAKQRYGTEALTKTKSDLPVDC